MPIPYRWRDALMNVQDKLRLSNLREAAQGAFESAKFRGENGRDKMDVGTIRRTLNENSIMVSSALGVVILIALIFMWRTFYPHRNTAAPQPIVLVDPDNPSDTETLTPKAGEVVLAPIVGKNGKEMVQGFFYTCDDCKTKVLAYLQKYTDEAKDISKKLQDSKGPQGMNEESFMKMQDGLLVRSPEAGSQWVKSNSPEGYKIIAVFGEIKCPGGQAPRINTCP